MKKKITLHDMSKKLGLSTAAISKALRGHEGVSDKTRKLIFETAKLMEYKGITEEKPTYSSHKVLVLVDSRTLTDPHSVSTYFYIERTLKKHGLEASYHGVSTSVLEQAAKDIIIHENPLAIFLFGRFSFKMVEELQLSKNIIIMIDYDFPYLNADSVLVDDYEGAFLAVQYLAKMGHLKIGFIGDNHLTPGFHARYQGFCDSLEYWGLDLDLRYMYDLRFKDAFGEIHFNILPDHLDYTHLPTAFFCANDPIAFVLNNALNMRGIRTPEEVSIVGFDNLDACQWQFPPFTSINYPREHIAKQALNILLWRLEHSDAPCNKIRVQPNLVVRESVSPPERAYNSNS